jgi:hypothetical protein
MDQIREYDDLTLNLLVAHLLGWTNLYMQVSFGDEWSIHGTTPGGLEQSVPNFTEDLSLTLDLLKDNFWQLYYQSDRFMGLVTSDISDLEFHMEYADSPPRSLVLSWVSWKISEIQRLNPIKPLRRLYG